MNTSRIGIGVQNSCLVRDDDDDEVDQKAVHAHNSKRGLTNYI